jgi:hypothetical protein
MRDIVDRTELCCLLTYLNHDYCIDLHHETFKEAELISYGRGCPRPVYVGRECTIYFKQSDSKYTVQTTRDGAMREVDVISESGKTYQTGDRTIITSYKDGTLFIQ